jgi:fructokinase
MLRAGIDLGGTKIEGVVLDATGVELFRERLATERELGYEHVLSRVSALYTRMCERIGHQPHTLGIGTPGAVSRRTGLLKNSNTVALNGQPVHRDLEARLGRAFAMDNDANCFALAEAALGAAQGERVVFGVIMGTGCGGGLVLERRVHTGRQAIGGEWGHMSIDPNGPACYCGQRGCVETYISGSGLEARYFERTGDRRDVAAIVAGLRRGEAPCVQAMAAFFDRFGRALANVIDLLDPDIVVLGGGLSNIDELYTTGVDAIGRYVFSDGLDTPIVRNRLGDSAGVIGAALIGR